MATNRFFRRLAQVLRETADLGAQSWHYEVSEPAGRPPWNSPPRVRAVTAASSGACPLRFPPRVGLSLLPRLRPPWRRSPIGRWVLALPTATA
jgi:hypothetical protein